MEEETDYVEKLRGEGHDWETLAVNFTRKYNKPRPATKEALQMRLSRRNGFQSKQRLSWSEAEVGLCVDSYVLLEKSDKAYQIRAD
jgi:hypothetical protein